MPVMLLPAPHYETKDISVLMGDLTCCIWVDTLTEAVYGVIMSCPRVIGMDQDQTYLNLWYLYISILSITHIGL